MKGRSYEAGGDEEARGSCRSCSMPKGAEVISQGKICFNKYNLQVPHFCPAGRACVAH